MATLCTCATQKAVAQWSLAGLSLNASQNNLSIAPGSFADKHIYFHNANYFLEFPGYLSGGLMSYGYNITLDNISRFYICPPGLALKTTIEEAGNAIVQIGNPINNTTVQINGNVELRSIKFPDNTSLTSSNFISTITGNSTRLTALETGNAQIGTSIIGINSNIFTFNSQWQTSQTGTNLRIDNLQNTLTSSISGLRATISQLSAQNYWLPATDGIQYTNGNINVSGSGAFGGGIHIPTSGAVAEYHHRLTVRTANTGSTSCTTVVVKNTSPIYNFPPASSQLPCVLNPSSTLVNVPVSGNSTIVADQFKGLQLAHTTGKEVTVTPEGNIRFRSGTQLGDEGLILQNTQTALTGLFSHFFQVRADQGCKATSITGVTFSTFPYPFQGNDNPCSKTVTTIAESITTTNRSSIVNNWSQGLQLSHTTTANPVFITPQGGIRATNLIGQNTRMLITDAAGNIGSQPLPVLTTTASITTWLSDGNNIKYSAGNVWIGARRPIRMNHTDFKLAVDGKIVAQSIYVLPASDPDWADDVFDKTYKLKPLAEVEKYIATNNHLEGIPATAEVQKNGIDLGTMDAKLLRKIEELYLHVIRLDKENKELKALISK